MLARPSSVLGGDMTIFEPPFNQRYRFATKILTHHHHHHHHHRQFATFPLSSTTLVIFFIGTGHTSTSSPFVMRRFITSLFLAQLLFISKMVSTAAFIVADAQVSRVVALLSDRLMD